MRIGFDSSPQDLDLSDLMAGKQLDNVRLLQWLKFHADETRRRAQLAVGARIAAARGWGSEGRSGRRQVRTTAHIIT